MHWETKNFIGLFYWDVHFIVVVKNRIQSIPMVCLCYKFYDQRRLRHHWAILGFFHPLLYFNLHNLPKSPDYPPSFQVDNHGFYFRKYQNYQDWNYFAYMPTKSTNPLASVHLQVFCICIVIKKSVYLSQTHPINYALTPFPPSRHHTLLTLALQAISSISMALNGICTLNISNFYLQPHFLRRAPVYTTYCLSHISIWMSRKHLKLNISETTQYSPIPTVTKQH